MTNERKITRHFRFLFIVVSAGLFSITTIAGLYYVYSLKYESAYNIAKVVEGQLKAGYTREAIYALSNAKLGSFEAIGYYGRNNERIFVLPPTVGPDYFKEKKDLWHNLMTTDIPIRIYFDEEKKDKAGTIRFSYNHAHAAQALLVFYVIGIAFLLPILSMFKKSIRRGVERDLLEEKNKGIRETVRQVWHDMNQPMQLLYVLTDSGRGMEPEVRDKIKSACDDMRSIMDDLKMRRDNLSTTYLADTCLAATLKEIVEKENIKLSSQKKSVVLEIEIHALSAFSHVNEAEVKRILSNLIDNASQASDEGKEIRIKLDRKHSKNIIQVVDEGEGIKPEHLAVIGKRGVTFRKNGNGLGISYAIEKIEEWNGKLSINSEYGVGTTIEMELPCSEVPRWFADKLNLEGISEFILTDDRPVIHTLVKEQLGKSKLDIKKHFHHSAEGFSIWYEKRGKELDAPLFVFDYDLGQKGRTGIDIIERFDLASDSVLMTNYYDDPTIQALASDANVKIFPKSLINYLGLLRN